MARQLQSQGCQGKTLLLALSGGLDSSVLLHVLAQLKAGLDLDLQAMHVQHGLSPHADDWAEFCQRLCVSANIPLQVMPVCVASDSGLGLEAAARQARYQALLAACAARPDPAKAGKPDFIVLAHHRDDQAETLLLQLLRGAGVKGLAAMPAWDPDRRLLRPLLDIPRTMLETYAAEFGLQWINDESNADTGFDRNFCRHEIFPLLQQRFPAVHAALARSAGLMAEADQLLDELALADARLHVHEGQLEVSGLDALSEARGRNLLRWWLSCNQLPLPSHARLQEMLRQLLSAKADAAIKLQLQDAYIGRYHGHAYIVRKQSRHAPPVLWQGEAELLLADGSRLLFEHRLGQGLAIERLGVEKLRISYRDGGERFKPDAARPTRTLKHLLQEAGIAPWLREQLPLVYYEDQLALVPYIGTACDLQARPDEAGLAIRWLRADEQQSGDPNP